MRAASLLLLLASACLTTRLYGERPWLSLRSEHFDVLTDASEENARYGLSELERIRAAELQLFYQRNPRAGRGRTLLILLNDDREVRYFTHGFADGYSARSLFGEPLIVAGMFGGGSEVLAHELA